MLCSMAAPRHSSLFACAGPSPGPLPAGRQRPAKGGIARGTAGHQKCEHDHQRSACKDCGGEDICQRSGRDPHRPMYHAVSVCCIQRVGARGQSGTQQSSLARVRAAAQGGSVRPGGRRRRKEGTIRQHRCEHDRQRSACKDCGVSPSEPLHTTCSRVRAIGF